jgi:hypothetical protein
MRTNVPGTVQGHEWFGEGIEAHSAERADLHGFFDLPDFDGCKS